MISEGWLRFEQTRQLVRLVHETREVPAESRGLHLVAGMRRMLGAVFRKFEVRARAGLIAKINRARYTGSPG